MVGSFNEYQKEAMKTAVYPNIGCNLAYPVLGLIDEIGELLIADNHEKLSELSDIYWYLAACYFESQVEYDMEEWFLGWDIETEIDHVFLDLSQLSGIAKKAHRDNDGKIQKEKQNLFFCCMARIHATVNRIADKLGEDRCEIMQHNLDKLADRQSRNVIKGDGDCR